MRWFDEAIGSILREWVCRCVRDACGDRFEAGRRSGIRIMRLDTARAAAFDRNGGQCEGQQCARLTHIKPLRTQERKIKDNARSTSTTGCLGTRRDAPVRTPEPRYRCDP
jgi:hypothetical protein